MAVNLSHFDTNVAVQSPINQHLNSASPSNQTLQTQQKVQDTVRICKNKDCNEVNPTEFIVRENLCRRCSQYSKRHQGNLPKIYRKRKNTIPSKDRDLSPEGSKTCNKNPRILKTCDSTINKTDEVAKICKNPQCRDTSLKWFVKSQGLCHRCWVHSKKPDGKLPSKIRKSNECPPIETNKIHQTIENIYVLWRQKIKPYILNRPSSNINLLTKIEIKLTKILSSHFLPGNLRPQMRDTLKNIRAKIIEVDQNYNTNICRLYHEISAIVSPVRPLSLNIIELAYHVNIRCIECFATEIDDSETNENLCTPCLENRKEIQSLYSLACKEHERLQKAAQDHLQESQPLNELERFKDNTKIPQQLPESFQGTSPAPQLGAFDLTDFASCPQWEGPFL